MFNLAIKRNPQEPQAGGINRHSGLFDFGFVDIIVDNNAGL